MCKSNIVPVFMHHATKACRGSEERTPYILTSKLVGGERWASSCCRITHR